MTNKRYKARKRLCVVFLVCTAFVMCSMTSFAAYAVKKHSNDAFFSEFRNSENYISGFGMSDSFGFYAEVAKPSNDNVSGYFTLKNSSDEIVSQIYYTGYIDYTADSWTFQRVGISDAYQSNVDTFNCYITSNLSETKCLLYFVIDFVDPVEVSSITQTGTSFTVSFEGRFYTPPNILKDVGTVTSTVLDVTGSVAETISNTPLLLLMAVGLPVVSFGTGLLIRIFKRT